MDEDAGEKSSFSSLSLDESTIIIHIFSNNVLVYKSF